MQRAPLSGDILGADGQIYNLVDLMGGGAPIDGRVVDRSRYAPMGGKVIGSDGRIYDLPSMIIGKTITIGEATSASITLVNSIEYRYGEVEELTIVLPEVFPEQFQCSVVFSSGLAPTVFTCPASVKWSGSNIDSNLALVPVAHKRYTLLFWHDGVNLCAISRGVDMSA